MYIYMYICIYIYIHTYIYIYICVRCFNHAHRMRTKPHKWQDKCVGFVGTCVKYSGQIIVYISNNNVIDVLASLYMSFRLCVRACV